MNLLLPTKVIARVADAIRLLTVQVFLVAVLTHKLLPTSTVERLRRAVRGVMDACGGVLSNVDAEAIARLNGVSTTTVRRVQRELRGDEAAGPTERGRGKDPDALPDEHKHAIAANHGNLKAAWRELYDAGEVKVRYRRFVQRFNSLPNLERMGLKHGAAAVAGSSLALKQVIDHRNDRWHFDHTKADIFVQYKNHVARPWLSYLIDAHSRYVLAVVVTFGIGVGGDPPTEGVIALLSQAMIGHEGPDGRLYGGRPDMVVFDNALAHLADAVKNGYVTLGIYAKATWPASPWQNGKVERFVRTVNDELLATLPGYTHGLEDRYGRIPSSEVDHAMPLAEFRQRIEEFVDHYNHKRVHQGIGGLTPAEAWNQDDGPVEFVDPDDLRMAFMSSPESRTVQPMGVKFRNAYYTHPGLAPYVGDEVGVRALPSNRDFIDVYTLDGEYICTAFPHDKLTHEQRTELRRIRERVAGRITTHIKKGLKLRHREAWLKDAEQAITDPDYDDTRLPDEVLADRLMDLENEDDDYWEND